MIKNVFITGVGGQGILTVSTIISDAAMACGFDAKKSEVHGMAQRGGSVVSHVRYGEKVYSSIIDKGQADVLISFEKLEALRYIDYLKKEGSMIVNNQKIVPSILGEPVPYPENAGDIFSNKVKRVLFFPAIKVAEELGNARATNIILLGAFANFAPEIDSGTWKKAIANKFPEKFHEINFKAFDKGMELAKGV